jgi:predicted ArsR family transcriptional regulator
VTPEDFDTQVARVAALGEPVRRSLYRFVVAQPDAVSRDQAAVGVGVAHHIAKFHLDRLESDGLLEVEYRRPPGRGGPGAGRPTKLYRRASHDVAVSLPERRYDLASHIMVEAIAAAQTGGTPVTEALGTAARAYGTSLGERATDLAEVLIENGYEPRADEAGVTLANCPFGGLARTHTALVCGMNLDLIDGVLTGLGSTVDGRRARLAPAPGRCCVVVTNA